MAQPQAAGQVFDKFWRRSVHDGLIAGTALPPKTVKAAGSIPPPAAPPSGTGGLEIHFAPDPAVYDGRFANNGWLQELPKPLTKLTWDNAAMIGPSTAARLGLKNEDVVEIRYRNRTVNAPVWVQPGHAPDAMTVHLGYGRTRAGRVAEGAGFNAFTLRTSDAPWAGYGAQLRKTGNSYRLAGTQGHHSMEGRAIVRAGTLEDFKAAPDFPQHLEEAPKKSLTLYPDWKYEGYKWGMAVDQTVCTGCSACVVACVAENNIPVIGKEQVLRGREMHWLRIDRYFEGAPDNPAIYHQPMLCQHCENAPCEVVCPVAATTHSPEGLNEMTYNRCVGTRVLLEQLPVQGAPVQLPALLGLGDAKRQAGEEPRRDGAQPRRHGEVHLLRAAHQSRAAGLEGAGSGDSRRRDCDRLPGGVPDRRHRVRRFERPEEPCQGAPGGGAHLRRAGGAQHAAADRRISRR